MTNQPPIVDQSFERDKWLTETRLRERDLDIKQTDADSKSRDVDVRAKEIQRSRWTNPIVLAIFAAAVAAAGNATVAAINGSAQRTLEEERSRSQERIEQNKAEAARILESVKTGDPDKAATNLLFLVDSGLVSNSEKLSNYLTARKAGQGISLPANSASNDFRLNIPREISDECIFATGTSTIKIMEAATYGFTSQGFAVMTGVDGRKLTGSAYYSIDSKSDVAFYFVSDDFSTPMIRVNYFGSDSFVNTARNYVILKIGDRIGVKPTCSNPIDTRNK